MENKKEIKVLVEVSARHIHLSKEDLEKLFGAGYELKKLKRLYEPPEFACQETIDIQLGSKKIEKVRIVGPLREQTQVEISLTDAVGSGVVPPIKLSGNLQGSASVILQGPVGKVELMEGLIVAQRHLHCGPKEAQKNGFKNGMVIAVKVLGERGIIFENVKVRIRDDDKICLHLDTDEGNAAGLNKTGEGIIL